MGSSVGARQRMAHARGTGAVRDTGCTMAAPHARLRSIDNISRRLGGENLALRSTVPAQRDTASSTSNSDGLAMHGPHLSALQIAQHRGHTLRPEHRRHCQLL